MDWNARFAASGPGRPGPPSVLVGREELVPRTGRGLDVACGRGTVAVWLALRGLQVDAVDAAPAGLALGRELAAAEGVAVRWIEADLDDGLPVPGPSLPSLRSPSPSLRSPRYDVVVCQRFRDPALYLVLAGLLAPGGVLVLTVLSTVGDAGGRFRAAPGELRAAFADLRGFAVLVDEEGGGEAHLVGRLD